MPDPVFVGVVLGAAAEKILDAVTSQASGALASSVLEPLRSRWGADPVQKSFRAALGQAVQRYSSSAERMPLSRCLLERHGPLSEARVADELSHVLTKDRDPDLGVIATAWKEGVHPPATGIDYDAESAILVSYLRDALRSSEIFAGFYDSVALDSISASASKSGQVLEEIEEHLAALVDLLDSRFATASRDIVGSRPEIRQHIRDATLIIEDKTRDFVGRSLVFEAITAFGREEGGGYFFVRGDPGIGKSSIAAELVRRNGCAHHFNSRAGGVSTPKAFLENVCAQLVALYRLPHDRLPERAGQDSGALVELLAAASGRLDPDERLLVVVDALDEADPGEVRFGQNPLSLPRELPPGVVVVVTMQNVGLQVTKDGPSRTLVLDPDSQSNKDDIREFLDRVLRRARMQDYIRSLDVERQVVVDRLESLSQGNFMYLHHVLPEIEKGSYQSLELDDLPEGLANYYGDHWRRMRGQDEAAWWEYKLPVIMALAVVDEPISLDLICDFSGVHDSRRVRRVLDEWRAFLHDGVVLVNGSATKRYSIYHRSFLQFIESQEEVAEERVSRRDAIDRMTDSLLAGSPFLDP